MTQEPPQRDLVPADKKDADLIEGDAGLVNLTPISVSTTYIEGAPLDQQRAFLAFQESQKFQAALWRPPVAGMLSVIFAVVAFYHVTLLMAPLAIITGIIAFFRKQRNWAAIGIIAGFVALVSDISFWALIGVTWTMHWLFWG